jgi:hypothetical protein
MNNNKEALNLRSKDWMVHTCAFDFQINPLDDQSRREQDLSNKPDYRLTSDSPRAFVANRMVIYLFSIHK